MPQERQRHQRCGIHGAQCLQVLRPLGSGFKMLRGDVFDKERLFRVKHGSEEMRAISIDRHVLQKSAKVRLGRIPGNNLSPRNLLTFVDDLDQAPVGEIANYQVSDGRQRLFIIEGRGQDGSGFGQNLLELGGADRSPVQTCILDRHSGPIRQRFGQTKIALSENARRRRGTEKHRAEGLTPQHKRHRDERQDAGGQQRLQVFRPLRKRRKVL